MVSAMTMIGAGVAILGAKKTIETLSSPDKEPSKTAMPKVESRYTFKNILFGTFLMAVVVIVLASSISILVWQPEITNKINQGINELNMSYALLDKRVTVLEGHPAATTESSLIQSGFRGAKDKFTAPEYLHELELFRSLNSQDQMEYLSLTKSQKLLKYADKLYQ